MSTGEIDGDAGGDVVAVRDGLRVSRRHIAAAGILLVGALLAFIAFELVDRLERDRVRFIFDQAAADRLFAVEESIEFNVEVIRAVVGFYESSSFVDRSEFSSFASPALFRRRSFQALAWIPRIENSARPELVSRAVQDGFPEFEIYGFDESGRRVIAPRRDEYYPVYYVEPILGNEESIGLDVISDLRLRAPLLAARDTGEITATRRVPIGDKQENLIGNLIFAPVYEIGKPLDGIELRRRFIKGFVMGSMRVGDAIENAIEERTVVSGQKAAGIDFYIFDATPGEPEELLHVRSARNRSEAAPVLSLAAASEGLHLSRRFTVGGRQWEAVARPSSPGFITATLWQPWAAALAVFGFAPLLAWFLNVVVKRREFAEALVVERTAELQASEQALLDKAELLTLLHSIADAANQASSLEEAIQFCISRICKFTGWPVGHAVLREDDESSRLVSSGLWYLKEDRDYDAFRRLTERTDFQIGEALPGIVVATGRPRWFTRQSVQANSVRAETAAQVGLYAGFAIPIMIRNRAVGALEFFSERAEDPNEDLIQAWMQIGTHLGRVAERTTIDRMKSEFVSTVSHELRTPLTSIQGSLGLIRGGALGEVPEDLVKMVDIAYNNSDRLVRLINDILDIEKIESGRMDYDFAPQDLAAVVRDSVEANLTYAAEFGVTIDLADHIPQLLVSGDRDRLAQVMANLLSNAAKFSPRGGVVRVNCEGIGNRVKVSVSDSGPGISEEFQGRIFGRFAQADSSDTRSKGGTGLGLSISKAIVEHHGGEIGFDTVPGQGCTFYFYLPMTGHGELDIDDGEVEPMGEFTDHHKIQANRG